MFFKDIKTAELAQCISLVTQLGLVVIASILIAGFIGFLIDKFLGTEPVFIIILGIMGIGGGFVSAYKLIIKSLESHDKNGAD